MTKEQIADKLNGICKVKYSGKLSGYAVQSIKEGRSSYPVSNLIEYCEGINVRMVMIDMATDEIYEVYDVMHIHEAISMLMNRYNQDVQYIYRKTAVHYTAPKNDRAPLSINTLLAVCSSLHCRIDFTTV